MTWSSVPLGALADVQLGKMLSPKARTGASSFPYLRNVNVQWGRLDLTDLLEMDFDDDEREKFSLRRGDLLVCEGGEPGRSAIVEADLPGVFFQKALMRVRPRDGRLDTPFLQRFMEHSARRGIFAKGGNQATIAHFPAVRLNALRIPLPPLPEQRRIADILDKADAIRRKRKEAIALTHELLRSAFLDMFGDPVANAKAWPVKALGDVIDHLDAGWSANGDARPRAEDEYGVLKVSAVTSGVFRPDEHKAVSANTIDRELVTPRRGDLLFSRANTRELVAATCLVDRDEPRLFLPDKLWRVAPRADAATAPYLRFLLAHDRFRSELTKTATGTSGSMLNVSMEKLRGLRGPFPPIDQQEKFAALVWKTLDAKAKYEAAHETTESLFNALVGRAFSGSREAAC